MEYRVVSNPRVTQEENGIIPALSLLLSSTTGGVEGTETSNRRGRETSQALSLR